VTNPETKEASATAAREEAAALVEACTDILSPATARKVASRIRALDGEKPPEVVKLAS
jgi:hypothetical protein